MFGGIRGVLQTPKLSSPQVTGKRWIFCKSKPQKHETANCLNFAKFQGLTLRHCFSRSGVRSGMFLKMSIISCNVSSWMNTAVTRHLQSFISSSGLEAGLLVHICALSFVLLEKLYKIICTFYLVFIFKFLLPVTISHKT